jgi:hypothetical protein
MKPSEIISSGEKLYGQQWRQPLALALGINIATLRRWTSGKSRIPIAAGLAIRMLLRERFGE